jgi:hypothetical protein
LPSRLSIARCIIVASSCALLCAGKSLAAQVQETVGQGAFIVTFKNLAKVKRLYSDIIQGLFFGFGAELWQEQHISDISL